MNETLFPLTRFNAICGESPFWCAKEKLLYWLDIGKKTIYKTHFLQGYDCETDEMQLPFEVYSIAKNHAGELIGVANNFVIKINFGRDFETLSELNDLPTAHRFNDAKFDTENRLWIGSMNTMLTDANACIYSFSNSIADNLNQDKFKVKDEGYVVANGLAWSTDNQFLYFVDTQKRCIYRYAFDAEIGELSGRRVHIEFDENVGKPDGICVDHHNNLWVAFWDGYAVKQYSSQGELITSIPLPIARPTSVSIGGKNNETLFITSASYGINNSGENGNFLDGKLLAIPCI